MKNKKLSRFEKLCEAIEEENLFNLGDEDDIVDDYEDNIDDIEGGDEGIGDEELGGEVTLTVSAEQVAVLKDILAQLDTEEGEEEDEFGGEEELGGDEEDGLDIENLEEEAVEFENAPDPESVKNKTKSGKASTKTGDLERDANAADEGPEKPFKFVRKEVPQELKHKTTSGHKGSKD